MPDDLDAWLHDYKPYVASVSICGRADLIADHSRLEVDLFTARADAGDVLADKAVSAAKRAVEEIEAEIEASEKEFTFQGIGHREWQNLRTKFPPSAKQQREGLDRDLDRFAPAAIAASSLDPKISVEQAENMMRVLPTGEYEKLFEATLQANGQVVGSPKSVLAAFIEQSQANGDSSTISLPEESPDPSLSDASDDPSPDTSTTPPDG